jgi:hypothetical protein
LAPAYLGPTSGGSPRIGISAPEQDQSACALSRNQCLEPLPDKGGGFGQIRELASFGDQFIIDSNRRAHQSLRTGTKIGIE